MASRPELDLEPGGFGVFDPGINAFSIATAIFPGALFVRSAELSFPENAQTPIAAEIDFASDVADGPLHCSLDWRRTRARNGRSASDADGASVRLTEGGARLFLDGEEQKVRWARRIPDIYRDIRRPDRRAAKFSRRRPLPARRRLPPGLAPPDRGTRCDVMPVWLPC